VLYNVYGGMGLLLMKTVLMTGAIRDVTVVFCKSSVKDAERGFVSLCLHKKYGTIDANCNRGRERPKLLEVMGIHSFKASLSPVNKFLRGTILPTPNIQSEFHSQVTQKTLSRQTDSNWDRKYQ
jgi:hypothetical protein